MHAAIVDNDAPVNLDGRAIVTRRVERVFTIAIGTEPTAPFDAELLLRERNRIRCHEVEIDLSLHAREHRIVAPARVGVERHGDPPLRPHPQDWHEEDRYEKNTCQPPHVRAPARRHVASKANRFCRRLTASCQGIAPGITVWPRRVEDPNYPLQTFSLCAK